MIKTFKRFKESKQRKPLLVVEGKELFQGDSFWIVNHDCESITHFQLTLFKPDIYDRKTFLTKDAADKYVSENKNSISYKDLEKYSNHCQFYQKLISDNDSRKWICQQDLLNHFNPNFKK